MLMVRFYAESGMVSTAIRADSAFLADGDVDESGLGSRRNRENFKLLRMDLTFPVEPFAR